MISTAGMSDPALDYQPHQPPHYNAPPYVSIITLYSSNPQYPRYSLTPCNPDALDLCDDLGSCNLTYASAVLNPPQQCAGLQAHDSYYATIPAHYLPRQHSTLGISPPSP